MALKLKHLLKPVKPTSHLLRLYLSTGANQQVVKSISALACRLSTCMLLHYFVSTVCLLVSFIIHVSCLQFCIVTLVWHGGLIFQMSQVGDVDSTCCSLSHVTKSYNLDSVRTVRSKLLRARISNCTELNRTRHRIFSFIILLFGNNSSQNATHIHLLYIMLNGSYTNVILYTVFQKKTSTHIIGYKLRNSCPILIIFDIKIPHII